MFPGLANTSGSSSARRDVEQRRNLEVSKSACPKTPHGNHVHGAKLGLGRVLSFKHLPLSHSVFNIVLVSAQEQMSWVYATWIVSPWAIVQHAKTIGDWAIGQFPGITMRQHCASLRPKLTVTGLVKRSDPQPARRGLFNTSPKASDSIGFASKVTEAAGVAFDLAGFAIDCFAAGETVSLHLKPFFSGATGSAASTARSHFGFQRKQLNLQAQAL